MHKHVLNIVPDMMNVIILHDVINRNIKSWECQCHMLPYYLVIYLVRSLADGNIFVIGSYSCIISRFSELGVTQLLTWLINVYFMFLIHVACTRLHVPSDVVYSFKYYTPKIKKMHVPHLCLLNWRFLGCFCWGFQPKGSTLQEILQETCLEIKQFIFQQMQNKNNFLLKQSLVFFYSY